MRTHRANFAAAMLVVLLLAGGSAGAVRGRSGTWTPLPAQGAPSARRAPLIWTGTEVVVWGGFDGRSHLTDMYALNPRAGTWRHVPSPDGASGSSLGSPVWDGHELLSWQATPRGAGSLVQIDRYVPAADTWSRAPASPTDAPCCYFPTWTGTSLYLLDQTGRHWLVYTPSTNSWSFVTPSNVPAAAPSSLREIHTFWTGSDILIWASEPLTPGASGLGIRYSPATNRYSTLPTSGAPTKREADAAVWTGQDLLVWGGTGECPVLCALGNGAIYNSATDRWRPISAIGAPIANLSPVAVWTGQEMIVWGGGDEHGHFLASGAAYNPTTDTWHPLPTRDAPSPRATSAVWTGSQMLIWGGLDGSGQTYLGDGAAYSPPSGINHDARLFPQTGFRIDNDTIWDYFNRRGGLSTFGYPISRTFVFQGYLTQFFQRRVVQIGPNGQARLLNLLGPGLLPYSHFNGATFPESDPALIAAAPTPTDARATLAFVAAHAPDTFQGMPVHFARTFAQTVPASIAFPNGGGDPSLLPGFDLEMWGIPTSPPMVDPNNHNFVSLRWQRGIMMYDARCDCTQGILLGDYLKEMLTGQNLPADLAAEAQNSPLLAQYAPGQPDWVRDPRTLPGTDLTNAFIPR